MSRIALSDTGDWQLVNDTQDIRGYQVVDANGQPVGSVATMVVDSEAELVTTLVLDNGTEVPTADVTIGENVVYLGTALADAEIQRGRHRLRRRRQGRPPRAAPRTSTRTSTPTSRASATTSARTTRRPTAPSGRAYDDDLDAYRYGYTAAHDDAYRNRAYTDAEPDLQTGLHGRPRLRRRPRGRPLRLRPRAAPPLVTPIRDASGTTAWLDGDVAAGQPVPIRLESGQQVRLAPDLVERRPDGSLVARVSFADVADGAARAVESVRRDAPRDPGAPRDFGRVLKEVDRALVSVRTGQTEETVTEPAWRETVNVRREAVDAVVTEVEDVRHDGNVTIVPMYEEVVVVERRLVLRERLHITISREETRIPHTVVLRHQYVEVERQPVRDAPPSGT